MREKSMALFICFLSVFLFSMWCWNKVTEEKKLSSNLDTNLNNNLGSNSASQYCEDNWWISEFRELSDWNELGTCFFVDWSFCDVWDYRSGSCMPGDNPVAKNNVEKLIEDTENTEKSV